MGSDISYVFDRNDFERVQKLRNIFSWIMSEGTTVNITELYGLFEGRTYFP